jgi:hypothetical protein
MQRKVMEETQKDKKKRREIKRERAREKRGQDNRY